MPSGILGPSLYSISSPPEGMALAAGQVQVPFLNCPEMVCYRCSFWIAEYARHFWTFF